MRRYLEAVISSLALDRQKMAFISGPRQAGKTTLAKALLKSVGIGDYHTWDDVSFRRTWVKSPTALLSSRTKTTTARKATQLLVFDEIHKARAWKRTIKGLYDVSDGRTNFIVTGSARLNVYRRGGDSLLGRYFHFRLHPFSLGELIRTEGRLPPRPDEFLFQLLSDQGTFDQQAAQILEQLFEFSGFPEPFLGRSAAIARLWRRGRLEKIIREDLRDLSRLPELSQVEMLAALLPEKVGSPLNVQSLREDLEVAHDTVKRWLTYLNELYYLFVIKPYSRSIPRSLKKEGKLYLWDWSEVPDPGPRFENLIALHLLKACHYWTDVGEGDFDLFYLRDKEKHEIDFLITRDRHPWVAFECKLSDTAPTSQFASFSRYLGPIPFIQLVAKAKKNMHLRGPVRRASNVLALLI